LNQPLSAIANYAKGCTRRLQADGAQSDELIEAMNSIAAEAMRASEIIRSLKRYVKKCKPQRELVDLNSIVKHAAQLVVGEAHRHDVALDLCCGDSLPEISADPIQLEQVVVNLLANGIDALEDSSASKQLTVHTRQSDGGGIEVTVADNGCGFPAELKHKIFEPFFTTKPHGLGMGLAISRSMIEAHGGRLHARRNEHGGATFVFTLPLKAEPCYA
jgi:two-component system sensor histidine kinase TtrS